MLVAAFELLNAGQPGGSRPRAWLNAAVVGAAIGPALGGVLTELLDWRAIFLLQAPIIATAGLMCRAPGPANAAGYGSPPAPRPLPPAAAVCLALLSAALTGVLFLAVLLLIVGWGRSPLAAAAVVSVLPLAALLGTRAPGDHAMRAIVGCTLVGIGVLCLAFLPLDSVAMTIVPLLVAGLGMGMALPALAGGLLPERTATEAARLLAVRHLGITLALVALAPIAAVQLDGAADRIRERGTALILDARLPPEDKLQLAQVAAADLDGIAPRTALRTALDQAGDDISANDGTEYERLRRRSDEALVMGINDAFAPTFLICGTLGLLAAGGLLITIRPRLRNAALATCASAALLVPVQAALAAAARPDKVRIADPCAHRQLPATGGAAGLLQDGVLVLLDTAACQFGSTREELALALIGHEQARAYADRYQIEAPSLTRLLSALGASGAIYELLERALKP